MNDMEIRVYLEEADVRKDFFDCKENNLKCPFCQQELVREGSNNYWCKKCNLERYSPALYGSQKLWQELICTRKALDVAVDMLKIMNDGLPKGNRWKWEIEKALEQITEQDQKDVK